MGVTTVPSDGEGRRPPRTVLLVVGNGHLSTHAIEDDTRLVIGREPSCDIALDHATVSRRHAIVVGGNDRAWVEDAGGTNRVRLAGQPIGAGERAPLVPGASFQVGPYTCVFLGAARSVSHSKDGRPALIVRDARASGLDDLLERVAASEVSVIVRGETGSGKEVLARTLHEASPRRGGPFVAINCAALSESLVESELFGYERGAFTGAVQAKPGLFEVASGGTLFLDEIGELPLATQAKLLRAIETRQVLRIGGVRPVELDIRLISATHRDLLQAAATGAFRQDLYFRLNGITVIVMPLRERRDVIPSLVGEFLAAEAARRNAAVPRISSAALAVIARHDWPGNVRELKAVVERAILLAGPDEIQPRHIMIDPPVASAPSPAAAPPSTASSEERERIIAALEQCGGNQTRAAKLLGVSRATLTTKLLVHNIRRPRKP